MKSNGKVTGTAASIPAGIGIGLGVSIIVTLLGAAGTAYLATAEMIGENRIGYAAMVILFVAAVSGAATAVGRTKRLRLQISLLAGISYFLMLLAVTALFFGGMYEGVGTTLILVLLGSLLVAVIPVRKARHRRIRHKTHR